MRVPFQTYIELDTRLNSREVYVRLRDAVPSKFSFASRSIYPVKGSVSRNECRLRARTLYNNSFQRRLRLSFFDTPEGTRLVGEFGLSEWVLIFMALWFGFTGLVSLVCLGALAVAEFDHLSRTPYQGMFSNGEWPWAFQPLGMVLFGVIFLRFGVWLSRQTEKRVIDFVQRTLTLQTYNS
jgi:hypothetical protein